MDSADPPDLGPYRTAPATPAEVSKDCPHCGLVNTERALRCDCGYDFRSGELRTSYLQPDEPMAGVLASNAQQAYMGLVDGSLRLSAMVLCGLFVGAWAFLLLPFVVLGQPLLITLCRRTPGMRVAGLRLVTRLGEPSTPAERWSWAWDRRQEGPAPRYALRLVRALPGK